MTIRSYVGALPSEPDCTLYETQMRDIEKRNPRGLAHVETKVRRGLAGHLCGRLGNGKPIDVKFLAGQYQNGVALMQQRTGVNTNIAEVYVLRVVQEAVETAAMNVMANNSHLDGFADLAQRVIEKLMPLVGTPYAAAVTLTRVQDLADHLRQPLRVVPDHSDA